MPNVVSNTGPLIALANIGQFGLLQTLFQTVYIPPAVRAEIQDEKSARALAESRWIIIRSVTDRLAAQMLQGELDRGESEAIVLAREMNADLVLIDERAAARKSRSLGMNTIGTLGVLLMAKEQGVLHAIKPALNALRVSGFRMKEALYHQVLDSAKESEP